MSSVSNVDDLVCDQLKTKSISTYKFKLFEVIKVEPTGNSQRGIECPKARSGHRIVANSGNIYSFGGYNPETSDHDEILERVLFKELWKYNLASRCWTKLDTSGEMPEELASHSAVMVGDHMIIFGGTGVPFGMSSSNSTHIYNLKTQEWSLMKTTGSIPPEQYGQAVTVHDNKLYVVGGTTGFDYSIGVHCLDLKSREWKFLDTPLVHPEKRYRHEIAIEGQQLFVFGGGTAFDSYGFEKMPVFDLEDNCWKSIVTTEGNRRGCPAPRRCHGCVQMGSDVYMCGGYNSQMIFSDIWKMNLKTMEWTKLPSILPNPVFFQSAALSPEGQMFIFGGVTNIHQNTRTNELFSVWLKVPSLAEMSWQAILHYVPHIAEKNVEDLLKAGIPVKYLKQVDFYSTDNKMTPEVEFSPGDSPKFQALRRRMLQHD